jgi:PAS domain-containing protein
MQMNRDGLLESVLSSMIQGVAVFDEDLKLLAWNQKFRDMRHYPDELVFEGQSVEALIRFDAEHGEFGPGNVDEIVRGLMQKVRCFEEHAFERARPDGTYMEVKGVARCQAVGLLAPIPTSPNGLRHAISCFGKWKS